MVTPTECFTTSKELRLDAAICLAALKSDLASAEFVAPKLWQDDAFVLKAVRWDGWNEKNLRKRLLGFKAWRSKSWMVYSSATSTTQVRLNVDVVHFRIQGTARDAAEACAANLAVLGEVDLQPISREREILQQAIRMTLGSASNWNFEGTKLVEEQLVCSKSRWFLNKWKFCGKKTDLALQQVWLQTDLRNFARNWNALQYASLELRQDADLCLEAVQQRLEQTIGIFLFTHLK